jgi:hypothetical protein
MKRIIMLILVFGFVLNLMGQRIDVNKLNINQLNFYKAKAIKKRNNGRALSLAGIAFGVTGMAILAKTSEKSPEYGLTILGVTGFIFYPCEIIGIPLWITGNVRKSKANLALKKFDFKTKNSMAIGLGVTLRF